VTKMARSDNWNIPRNFYPIEKDDSWIHQSRPFKDEVFSSWFTRIAKENCAEPLEIIKVLEKRRVRHNKYDLDTHIKYSTLQTIAKVVNQSISDFFYFRFLVYFLTSILFCQSIGYKIDFQ